MALGAEGLASSTESRLMQLRAVAAAEEHNFNEETSSRDEKLRQMDPEVLAIVSSGYSDDPVMAKPAAYGFAAVLPKPYEPADMIRLVKTVLAQREVKQ